jgi:RNA 2',3'-cyclic 3'-phosphodiesterase
MRLFIGIPMSAAVTGELAAISARLHSRDDSLRWSAPESWHITLQFLGNTSPKQYACMVARLRELHLPPVFVRLEGIGFFDRAGIFYAGVHTTPELLALQRRVTHATAQCGFLPEVRPYQPHITLARSKGDHKKLLALKAKVGRSPVFSRFTAEEFLLYESFLASTGSRYEVRERFQFVST